MDSLDFIRVAQATKEDDELAVWATRLAETIADQAIRGTRLADRLPDDLQESYWHFVAAALAAMPEYMKFTVTGAVAAQVATHGGVWAEHATKCLKVER